MGRLSRSMRALFGAMLCFLCVGLLVSVTVESREMKAMITVGSLKSMQSSSSEHKPIAHLNLDPFLSSKRRVPSGADPIHNRGAGKSGRPPGRV